MLEMAADFAKVDRVEGVRKAAIEVPALGGYQRSLLDSQTFSITPDTAIVLGDPNRADDGFAASYERLTRPDPSSNRSVVEPGGVSLGARLAEKGGGAVAVDAKGHRDGGPCPA